MDLKDFKESLDRNTPPEDLGRALQALWYQAKGEWDNRLNADIPKWVSSDTA